MQNMVTSLPSVANIWSKIKARKQPRWSAGSSLLYSRSIAGIMTQNTSFV